MAVTTSARDLVRHYLEGRPVERSPIVLHIGTYAARLQHLSYQQVAGDPTLLANSLQSAQKLFGCDGLIVLVDDTLEAEACGCGVEWHEDEPVVVSHALAGTGGAEDVRFPSPRPWCWKASKEGAVGCRVGGRRPSESRCSAKTCRSLPSRDRPRDHRRATSGTFPSGPTWTRRPSRPTAPSSSPVGWWCGSPASTWTPVRADRQSRTPCWATSTPDTIRGWPMCYAPCGTWWSSTTRALLLTRAGADASIEGLQRLGAGGLIVDAGATANASATAPASAGGTSCSVCPAR